MVAEGVPRGVNEVLGRLTWKARLKSDEVSYGRPHIYMVNIVTLIKYTTFDLTIASCHHHLGIRKEYCLYSYRTATHIVTWSD